MNCKFSVIIPPIETGLNINTLFHNRSSLFLPNNNLNEIVNGLSSDVLNEDSLREKCNEIMNKTKIAENGIQKNESSHDTNGRDISFSIGSSGPNTTTSDLKDVTLNGSENQEIPIVSNDKSR